jgi:hypothetical protein
MNPQGTDLLAQLRDIHAAPDVSWWPLAPGWWLVGVAFFALVLWFARHARRAWERNRRRRQLLQCVTLLAERHDPDSEPQALAAGINRILKWVAIEAFPEVNCARLQGSSWTEFLSSNMDDGSDTAVLSALAAAPYQPQPEIDVEAMIRISKAWISRNG